MRFFGRRFDQDGTRPAKKFGIAAYVFDSPMGGVIGSEKAKAALAEFDRAFPNRLIYDKCEVRETPGGLVIAIEYLTNDEDPHSLWQKFSEIARRRGL